MSPETRYTLNSYTCVCVYFHFACRMWLRTWNQRGKEKPQKRWKKTKNIHVWHHFLFGQLFVISSRKYGGDAIRVKFSFDTAALTVESGSLVCQVLSVMRGKPIFQSPVALLRISGWKFLEDHQPSRLKYETFGVEKFVKSRISQMSFHGWDEALIGDCRRLLCVKVAPP